MTMKMVKLSQLSPGDEINVRHTGQKSGLDELIASIRVWGLLQPIIVRRAPGVMPANGIEIQQFVITDGRRRYYALKKIHGKKDVEVAVSVREGNDSEAREISLTANIVRVPLHPVDEYDAYAKLIEEGSTAADIGQRFGVTEKWVSQRLQLRKLAPELREEWRKGKMTRDQAEALTASPEPNRQIAVWKEAKKLYEGTSPEKLRAAARRSGVTQDDPRVQCVGIDVYLSEGGRTTDDLFDDTRLLLDVELLNELTDRRIEERCDSLVAAGWAWARNRRDVKDHWRYLDFDVKPFMTADERLEYDRETTKWKRREEIEQTAADRATADPETRAKTGVFVSLARDGGFETEALKVPAGNALAPAGTLVTEHEDELDDDPDDGLDDPQPPDASPLAAGEIVVPESPRVNFALREMLSEQLTRAMSAVLAANPETALSVLLITMRASLNPDARVFKPLQIDMRNAWPALRREQDSPGRTFSAALAETRSTDLIDQVKQLATCVAQILDLRRQKATRATNSEMDAIVNALASELPADEVRAQLSIAFDAALYFAKLSHAECKAALEEMGQSGNFPTKKADIAAVAVQRAAQVGWLPKELRTPHYDGPPNAGDI